MVRKPTVDMSAWPSLTLEGNLIAPAMIARIDQRDAPEQAEADYLVRRGLTIREEISLAFRVGQAHFDAFAKAANPSQAATIRFIQGLLSEAFGFDDVSEGEGLVALAVGEHRVPVVVVPPEDALDRRSAALSIERSRSAAYVLQDFLNEKDEALWGLVTNGHLLRLMRDNASLTRPAHIEADLAQIFQNEDAASFATLWLLIHRSRFGAKGSPATDCALERWRDSGSKEGEAARDRLAGQVQQALKVLGTGFLQANPDLAQKLQSGQIYLTAWFNELLRLVYRLIFLMVAEDRNLLHPPNATKDARKLYADGYSLAHLRAHCIRRTAWDRHHDRYEGIKIVFRSLARGEPKLGLTALGGLFDPYQLPHLEQARLSNRAFMEAIYRLAWLTDKTGIMPVNWRAMETEELGSVYESLLELQPQLADGGRELAFASEATEQKGNQRKTTGSYYTPDSLVQALLDTALDPVLDRREAEADDAAEGLLSLTVIDPACGSGHFLLAAARRIATRVARHRAEGTPSALDFQHALRDVARRCLHGVDRNPMAVELTKVALWIETMDPGKPLGFLDAQIRCGDALLGVFDLAALADGVPDAAYKPLTGDDKETARHFAKRNKSERAGQGALDFGEGGGHLPPVRPLAVGARRMRALPEETLADVREKQKRFRSLREGKAWYDLQLAADLYVAAFLLPKTGGVPESPGQATIPTTAPIWQALAGKPPYGPLVGRAQDAAGAARAFHWPLEFPDVMAGREGGAGGFDVVLGNPPWERIKLQEKEFFAARDPDIASAANAAARTRLIKSLATAPVGSPERALFDAFEQEKRLSEATSAFVRIDGTDGGRFPLTGTGDVNTYALFAELFARLITRKGRAGVILPTGIATDATTAPFFSEIVTKQQLIELHDFQTGLGYFDRIGHARFKFCLLLLSGAFDGPEDIKLSFFSRTHDEFMDPQRKFTLSVNDFINLNPNTRTAPVFRTRRDAELTAKIYRAAPVLIEDGRGPAGNPWGVNFARLFDMSTDSGLFRTAKQLTEAGFMRDGADWVAEGVRPRQAALAVEGAGGGSLPLEGGGPRNARRYVPLYEAKMIHQFDHRWATYDEDGASSTDVTLGEKQDPDFEPAARYWVPEDEVGSRLAAKDWTRGWLMGWRDICRATDERTMIGAPIPAVGCGDKYLLMLPSMETEFCGGLIGNMTSLNADYAVRQKLGGTSFKYFTMKQIPFLPPNFYTSPRLDFISPRVLELTYTSHSLAPFARDLGYDGPPFPWDEDRRARLRAELDAFYARAYGLSRDELRYILDPADVMGDGYPSETFRVLKNNELRKFGEYRTQRLVLQAWDRMESDGTFAGMGM